MRDQIDQARWFAVLLATALALYLCWLMLRPFIGVLAWAVVLVIVFYPVHLRLRDRIKNPSLSSLISCLLVVLLAVLPLTLLTIAVADELGKVLPNLPSQISSLMDPQTSVIGRVAGWIQGRFGVDTLRSQEFMVEQLKRSSEFLLSMSLNLAGNIATGIVKAFFVIFTMYYLFRDGDRIVSKLPAALPLEKKESEAIIARTREVVSASVYGIVVIAALQGLLGGIAFWVLGIPSPLLWAVLMTFVCMIPVLGSFLVWVPLAIYLIMNGHWTKGILLVVWGALVISTVDNFLRPKWMKNQTRLHELLVFFSVLGGISIFGLLGIILGPVILAITLGLLHTFRAHPS
ncbi:MAG TPA: AI-2E family transporter [Pyrinomonadaceae bacterium]|nr:AI-2E family transporter [Pyrinomonadaceae bacterium]